MQWLQRVRIPESDVAIGCSAARCQQTVLVWAPADGFDSCSVIMELDERLLRVQVPDHEFIVIASRGELLVVEAPF